MRQYFKNGPLGTPVTSQLGVKKEHALFQNPKIEMMIFANIYSILQIMNYWIITNKLKQFPYNTC